MRRMHFFGLSILPAQNKSPLQGIHNNIFISIKSKYTKIKRREEWAKN